MSSEFTDPKRHRGGATDEPLFRIWPFDLSYEARVQSLIVKCLRELVPPFAQVELEAYIAGALAGDLRDIATHYQPRRGRGFWLALAGDGELAGTFALLPHGEDRVELRRMYVSVAFRRRGVARAMLARAEALCVDWGFRSLFLTTSSLNSAAIELYRKTGFRQRDHVPENIQGEPPPGVRVFAFDKALPRAADRDEGSAAPGAYAAIATLTRSSTSAPPPPKTRGEGRRFHDA